MSAFDDWMNQKQPPDGKAVVTRAMLESFMRDAWNARGAYDIEAVMKTADPRSMDAVLAAVKRLNA